MRNRDMSGAVFVVAVLLALFAVGVAQGSIDYCKNSLPLTGGTLTGAIVLPAGALGAPAVAIGQADMGFYRIGADRVAYTSGSTAWSDFLYGDFRLLRNDSCFVAGASVDAKFCRDAAATWQFGLDAATAPAYTLKGADSTGADVAGAAVTLRGGAGTAGNAKGGQLILGGGANAGTGERGAVQIEDGGTKPTCAAGIRGSLWYEAGGAGVADTFQICAKQAAGDTYAWRTAATIP